MRLDIPALIVPGRDAAHATSAARYLEECLPRVGILGRAGRGADRGADQRAAAGVSGEGAVAVTYRLASSLASNRCSSARNLPCRIRESTTLCLAASIPISSTLGTPAMRVAC